MEVKEENQCVRVMKCWSKQKKDLRTPGMMLSRSGKWMYQNVSGGINDNQERCPSAPKQRLIEGCSVE